MADLTANASVETIKAASEKIRKHAQGLDTNDTAILDQVKKAPGGASSSGESTTSASVDNSSGKISGLTGTTGSIDIAAVKPENLNASQKTALKDAANKRRLESFVNGRESTSQAKDFIGSTFGIDVPLNRAVELSKKLLDLSGQV